MSCTNCSSGPVSTFGQQYFYSNTPSNCGDDECGNNSLNALCVYYAGPNLACSGILTNDSIELALQKMDEQICSATGDYSAYSFGCLDDDTDITTESEFVEVISGYVCTLRTDLDTFIDTTFPAYQQEVEDALEDITIPAVTVNPAVGIEEGDTLPQIIDDLAGAINDLQDEVNVSTVTWDACFSVPTPPATLSDAFDLLADQICQVKALATTATLPTFNNVGSCLASPGAADTLVDTVGKIRTRVCLSPTLDNANLTSSCITIPATATDLEGLLNNMLARLDTISQSFPTFDEGDFAVAATDGGDACSGVTVSLQTALNVDRFVATDADDDDPGTLIEKFVGVGITVDNTTNPGQITLTSTATTDNFTVKASSGDDTPGALDAKVTGTSSTGIAITTIYNAITKKLEIQPAVDLETLITEIFNYIENSSDMQDRLCALNADCPSPCDAPTNVQAISLSETTSTTTTTTTTEA